MRVLRFKRENEQKMLVTKKFILNFNVSKGAVNDKRSSGLIIDGEILNA